MKLNILLNILAGFSKYHGNPDVVIRHVDSDSDITIEDIIFMDDTGKIEILIDG